MSLSYDPNNGFPVVVLELVYCDPATALTWLCRAFGFRERLRCPGPGGTMTHAELHAGDDIVMIGPTSDVCRSGGAVRIARVQAVIAVDDLDEHLLCATSAGALVIALQHDERGRLQRYDALDVERHFWRFLVPAQRDDQGI